MKLPEDLRAEAEAFDERIRERIRHGHIPDLRLVQPCDWFYNNPWRRPYLVELAIRPSFEFALQHARPGRLLDVGCGPGHMTLEFARHGFDVTGIDISAASLATAEALRESNPFRDGFGSLRYVNSDFLTADLPPASFDTVCFFGSLHHQPDLESVLDKAAGLLKAGGRVITVEPGRDLINETNGAVVALARVLLGAQGWWYERVPVPTSGEALQQYVAECLSELRGGHDPGEGEQSPQDNACAAGEILEGLRGRFSEVGCRLANGFLHRLAGGVRGGSEEQTRQIAEFLYAFEEVAIRIGLIQPGQIYWAGQRA